MKAENMKVGMPVMIKKDAGVNGSGYVGQIGVIQRMFMGVDSRAFIQMPDGDHIDCHAFQIRKAPPSST